MKKIQIRNNFGGRNENFKGNFLYYPRDPSIYF